MKTMYVTTPLYYVNDVPHVGHAYTTIATDILARWHRMNGKSVFFLTGTDEHGAKISKAAEDAGESPQDFVNRIAAEYKRMWTALTISHDDFIQTSDPRHQKVVQAVFEKLLKSGDIYKGSYEDWYCIHDETYISEADLVDKKCPTCGREVQRLKEESYFFKLSHYQDRLLAYFSENPEFLSPAFRANEIINFVKSGLKDLSVSRTRVKWGVPLLSDPSHTVYVWFDALLNYISVPGYHPERGPVAKPFSDLWPADVHLVGKEIYRFHTVIWPAMLMALGIPLPKKVFAHGWWTVEGQKMSKSLGNVVNPHDMIAEYGVDPFRYFLFREVPFGSDGDFSEKALLGRYNAELANNVGNLLQRTITLLVKNFDSEIPAYTAQPELLSDMKSFSESISGAYHRLALGDVLEQAFGLMLRTNKFIDEKAPWKLTSDQKEELAAILVPCLAVLKVLAIVLHPFMPTKTQEMWERMGEKGTLSEHAPAELARMAQGDAPVFVKGQTVVKADPLFLRKGGRWK